jgi:hypothetical protein
MAATVYYRTGKGTHRHTSWYCANAHRLIATGDPFAIPAEEAPDWTPCADCCTTEDVTAGQAQAAAKADAMCPNSGTVRAGSRRIYDDCRDCGKNGKVGRNGTLRAHKPEQH